MQIISLIYTQHFVVESQTLMEAPEECCIPSIVARFFPIRKSTWKHWQCNLELLRFIFNWKEDNYTTLIHLSDWNLNYKRMYLTASLICRLACHRLILYNERDECKLKIRRYWMNDPHLLEHKRMLLFVFSYI